MSPEMLLSSFEDIQDCIGLVKKRFENIKSAEEFLEDEEGLTKLDAISLRLQVIGESVKNVEKIDKEFLKNYSAINWREIMKLRDLISHHYYELDYEIVFDICKNEIPKLEVIVSKIINDLKIKGMK
jgi:uncharacterized protein with HEPN domain